MNLRAPYQAYLAEEATRRGLSEERIVELALAAYQSASRYAGEGYYPVYLNMAGERHPLDNVGGCMGDD